jgi:hypothetical protein
MAGMFTSPLIERAAISISVTPYRPISNATPTFPMPHARGVGEGDWRRPSTMAAAPVAPVRNANRKNSHGDGSERHHRGNNACDD